VAKTISLKSFIIVYVCVIKMAVIYANYTQ